MSRVLIVEDEQHLADGLRFNLEAEGYSVEVADAGEAGLELLNERPDDFDVLVLDIMLPGKDGFTVMSELRAAGRFVPTLMLTARGRPEDVLRGFECGADDYLTKPFELPILLARIKGLLRRQAWSQTPKTKDTFEFQGRLIDFDNLELHVGEKKLMLTVMEANLLRYLVQHEGQVSFRSTGGSSCSPVDSCPAATERSRALRLLIYAARRCSAASRNGTTSTTFSG